eukprot:2478915-Prymnesium_polylepis.1
MYRELFIPHRPTADRSTSPIHSHAACEKQVRVRWSHTHYRSGSAGARTYYLVELASAANRTELLARHAAPRPRPLRGLMRAA